MRKFCFIKIAKSTSTRSALLSARVKRRSWDEVDKQWLDTHRNNKLLIVSLPDCECSSWEASSASTAHQGASLPPSID
jgi:hypothetical protein